MSWAQPDVSLSRSAPDRVVLRWRGLRPPIHVFLLEDAADSPTLVADTATGEFAIKAERADCVLLVRDNAGATTRIAERVPLVAGGRNFRDAGGYYARDGRQMRWRRVFRSGDFATLTESGRASIRGLGIDHLFDLRSSEERSLAPSGNIARSIYAPQYSADKISYSAFATCTSMDEARELMAQFYVQLLPSIEHGVATMFEALANQAGTVAVNCSAGKDRTGIAIALLLSALDVPEEQIVADYAMSEQLVSTDDYARMLASGSGKAQALPAQERLAIKALPREVLNILLGSDPDVMRRFLQRLANQPRGLPGFLDTRLHFGANAVEKLRAALLYPTRAIGEAL